MRQIQSLLNSDPALHIVVPVTGVYGPLTEQGIKKLQCAYLSFCRGLGYGQVGPKTRVYLNGKLGNSGSVSSQASPAAGAVAPTQQAKIQDLMRQLEALQKQLQQMRGVGGR